MKKTPPFHKLILFFILLAGISIRLPAQPANTLSLPIPDILPKFSGGTIELYKFFNQQMVYTDADKEMHMAGELIVTFIVDTSGKILNLSVRKGVSSKIDLEALRVIQSMPAWIPAQLHGQKVNSRFSLAMMINAQTQIAVPIF